jgi:hypothetical protein
MENNKKLQCNGRCEFSLDDWFDLFFPPDRKGNGYICVVFQTFLDDSKHSGGKLMVSAGFCANVDAWSIFRKDWVATRLRHGIDYFKSSECNHVDGQLRKFRKGKYAQVGRPKQCHV